MDKEPRDSYEAPQAEDLDSGEGTAATASGVDTDTDIDDSGAE